MPLCFIRIGSHDEVVSSRRSMLTVRSEIGPYQARGRPGRAASKWSGVFLEAQLSPFHYVNLNMSIAEQYFREIFETDCVTYFVFNGTAANSLAIGSFCSSHHSVLCHRFSHVESDECNAPGFLNHGLRVVPIDGANGRIDPSNLQQILR